MAGSNLMLKPGQVLFHEGDKSDGMYLIRKGELQVYLEKGDQEVKLAVVGAGSMIGEMALFDKKPRSAAAKAVADTEVTKISNDDFKKIMKQIPKWFVSLMVSLSTRLRETNERLQKIEAKVSGSTSPLENIYKIVGVLSLLYHKDGTKEAKSWLLERDPAEAAVAKILGIEAGIVQTSVKAMVDGKLMGSKPNSYKKQVLFVPNKGVVEKFAVFVAEFREKNPGEKGPPKGAIELMECINKLAQESAYDSATVSLEDASVEGDRNALDTAPWKDCLPFFKTIEGGVQLVKVSDGIGFKVDKKDFPRVMDNYRILDTLNKAGVS